MLQLDDIRVFCIDGGHSVGGALRAEQVVGGVGLTTVAMVLEQVVALGWFVDMLLAQYDVVVAMEGYILMGALVAVGLVLLLSRNDWLQSLAYPLRGDTATGDLVSDLVVGVVLSSCARASGHRASAFVPLSSP